MTKTTKYSIDQAAQLLGVFGKNNNDIRIRCTSRLIYLGYSQNCSRCGGSGNYSFNQIDGSRCYGCGGSGKQLVDLTEAVIAEARARIDTGELIPYFQRGKMIRHSKAIAQAVMDAWKASRVGKDYSAHRTPWPLTEEQRNEHYDRFFASPLFRINYECGEIFKESVEIEEKIKTLNAIKDGDEIDSMLRKLVRMKDRIEELDKRYLESLSSPEVIKSVFAHFLHMGRPHYVRVSAATPNHQNMAREYLAKVIPNQYYAKMEFQGWVDDAPEGFHDLYTRRDDPKADLTEFLTNLSETPEVIKNAV
jgi:hypothetical protein